MASTPEGKTKAHVRQWLKDRNIYYFCPIPSALGGSTGVPDFVCCVPPTGKFLGVECKAPGKRANTTENQKRQINLIQRAGGWALVVDDVDQMDEFWQVVNVLGMKHD